MVLDVYCVLLYYKTNLNHIHLMANLVHTLHNIYQVYMVDKKTILLRWSSC